MKIMEEKSKKAKKGKNGCAQSENKNGSSDGGNQETEKKGKKSKKAYLEVAVKESNVESSDGKEKNIKTTKKTNTEPLMDAADSSAVKEKEKLPKKKKRKLADDKPVEPEDCTVNQEVTETKLKKKTLKNESENAEEVEEEQQTGERKQIKKGKKRKCEASVVTEGSGKNFTGVKQKKKYDEETHKASEGICVAKKKVKTVVADQVETEPLEEDAVEGDGVKQVKKMKKSKKEKTEDVEKAENEDGAIKKKKAKSENSETVKEEEMVSEKKVKKEKIKKASVEVTEVEEEETVKKKKKKKSQQLNGEEKEQQTVECEEEQSGKMDVVSKKKKKKPSESSEAQGAQDECDAGAKKRKKIREKGDEQQERRQALQNDIDQGSQPATPTKPEGLGQWSTAQFDSADQQQKFLRLMGGFKKGFQPASGTPGKANMALGKDAQLQLQQGLQGQFERAHSRRIDSGNRGAGLGFAAPSNKKFFIDVNASRSVRFDD
ncbi:uncharacterized protein knop1 isoform X2 [Nelusetta ayraudi]|uniref:uncharacterized protein knop1 isoform X2 n=1 Tax=Nelusetta ayraudi TaxID=303726 RepID=UPI003F72AD94